MICFRKIICFYGKMHQKGWLLIAKLKEIYKDHLDMEIWSGATNPLLTPDNFERGSDAQNLISMNRALVTQLRVCSREKYPSWCNLFETWD